MSVVAFTYSAFQLVAEVHYFVTRRHIIQAPFHSYFNLAMDQVRIDLVNSEFYSIAMLEILNHGSLVVDIKLD